MMTTKKYTSIVAGLTCAPLLLNVGVPGNQAAHTGPENAGYNVATPD